jgi:glutamate-1-semialdehyde 2,1-aminomutase
VSEARSQALFERAQKVLVGGVNSPVRAMRAIGRNPLFIAAGQGAELIDVDSNRYIDFVCSWGPLIAGHSHPAVVEAIAAATRHGASFGAPTEGEVLLAEELCARIPSAQMVRMTCSGTEATMTALRLARAVTGREAILKFAGAYHGHSDALLAAAGSGIATGALPDSAGVPPAVVAQTIVVPWNDAAALGAATASHRLAAIILEPLPANMGLVAPAPGFLELVAEQARANGALLIADEVISGLRVARGGAQELLGLRPDLTTLGKIIGGGLPAGALAGARELMEHLAPCGEVYQAGTLSGNPLAVAAGMATLALLDADAYTRLGQLTELLAAGLREALGDYPATVVSAPGLLTIFFAPSPPTCLAEVQACDLDAHARFCRALLAQGIYPPPSQFEAWFISLAHSEAQIERTVEAARRAVGELAA